MMILFLNMFLFICFQPEITSFASGLLPLLFQYLGKASQEAEKNPKGLTKSYYALETFCENLG